MIKPQLCLGLSISHSIIEQHGGRIDFESIPDGKTKFTVILPLDENSLLDPPIENSAVL